MARKRKKQKASFAIESMFEKHVTYFDGQGQPIGKPKVKPPKKIRTSPQMRLL